VQAEAPRTREGAPRETGACDEKPHAIRHSRARICHVHLPQLTYSLPQVLGHADGVCHCFVDAAADVDKALKVVVDGKTDYPAACNAIETVLLHEDTLLNGVAAQILQGLRKAGVKCMGGPRAMTEGLCDVPAEKLKIEYGDLRCTVEVVSGLQQAADHIHKYGSGHTESIVTENKELAEKFLKSVDAACVFHNASNR
jgi:delta-1-pyrroline-5-carboxylate synthetase